jgi:hypothetical protein
MLRVRGKGERQGQNETIGRATGDKKQEVTGDASRWPENHGSRPSRIGQLKNDQKAACRPAEREPQNGFVVR